MQYMSGTFSQSRTLYEHLRPRRRGKHYPVCNDDSTDFKHSSPFMNDQKHQRIAIKKKIWLQANFLS